MTGTGDGGDGAPPNGAASADADGGAVTDEGGVRAGVAYLDSSALVKLVLDEAESAALQAWLRRRPRRASCALARVEVLRAVRGAGGTAVARGRRLLGRLDLVAVDDPLLDDAADLGSQVLRSLDAVHLAAARTLGERLDVVVTYDRRMGEAARALGLPVSSPA